MFRRRQLGDYPEVSIAISSNGGVFAVTAGDDVKVYARNGKGAFGLPHATLQAPSPKLYPGQSPTSIKFSAGVGGKAGGVLAVAWEGDEGTSTALTAHEVTATTAKLAWSHMAPCAANGYDGISPDGLAVSAGGEWVVFGTWGCHPISKNLKVFQGIGGQGKPVLQDTLPGQIWAVDVDVAGGKAAVAAGSWLTQAGTPSKVALYTSS